MRTHCELNIEWLHTFPRDIGNRFWNETASIFQIIQIITVTG